MERVSKLDHVMRPYEQRHKSCPTRTRIRPVMAELSDHLWWSQKTHQDLKVGDKKQNPKNERKKSEKG